MKSFGCDVVTEQHSADTKLGNISDLRLLDESIPRFRDVLGLRLIGNNSFWCQDLLDPTSLENNIPWFRNP